MFKPGTIVKHKGGAYTGMVVKYPHAGVVAIETYEHGHWLGTESAAAGGFEETDMPVYFVIEHTGDNYYAVETVSTLECAYARLQEFGAGYRIRVCPRDMGHFINL